MSRQQPPGKKQRKQHYDSTLLAFLPSTRQRFVAIKSSSRHVNFFFHCLELDYVRKQGNRRRSQDKRESQGKSVDNRERQNSGEFGVGGGGGMGLEKQVGARKTGTEKKEIEVTDEEEGKI